MEMVGGAGWKVMRSEKGRGGPVGGCVGRFFPVRL